MSVCLFEVHSVSHKQRRGTRQDVEAASRRTERHANDKEAGVEGLLGDDVFANLGWARGQLVDGHEAPDEEQDSEEQERVGENRVDAETCDHDGVVAAEVPCLWKEIGCARRSSPAVVLGNVLKTQALQYARCD